MYVSVVCACAPEKKVIITILYAAVPLASYIYLLFVYRGKLPLHA